MKSLSRFLFSLGFAALLLTQGLAIDRDLKTTPVMRLETRTLVQMLEYFHYNKDGVTSSDYPDLISNYLKELDP